MKNACKRSKQLQIQWRSSKSSPHHHYFQLIYQLINQHCHISIVLKLLRSTKVKNVITYFLPWGFLRYPVIDWNYFLHECLHICPIIHSHALNIRKYSTCTNTTKLFLVKVKEQSFCKCFSRRTKSDLDVTVQPVTFKQISLIPSTKSLHFILAQEFHNLIEAAPHMCL